MGSITIDRILEDYLVRARRHCTVVSVPPTTPLIVPGVYPIVEGPLRDLLCTIFDDAILSNFKDKTLLVTTGNEIPRSTSVQIRLVMSAATWADSVLTPLREVLEKKRDRLMMCTSPAYYGKTEKLPPQFRSHISGGWSGILIGYGPTGMNSGGGHMGMT